MNLTLIKGQERIYLRPFSLKKHPLIEGQITIKKVPPPSGIEMYKNLWAEHFQVQLSKELTQSIDQLLGSYRSKGLIPRHPVALLANENPWEQEILKIESGHKMPLFLLWWNNKPVPLGNSLSFSTLRHRWPELMSISNPGKAIPLNFSIIKPTTSRFSPPGLRLVKIHQAEPFVEEYINHPAQIHESLVKSKKPALIIHGIVSQTAGNFKGLKLLLNQRRYDSILTFDYNSVFKGVRHNGSLLQELLLYHLGGHQLNQRLDIFGHSMGGLVARSFIEEGKGALWSKRLFMAGTPNKGSVFANLAHMGIMLAYLLFSNPLSLISNYFLTQILGLGFWNKGLKDIATNSAFLQDLYEKGGPPNHVDYHLLNGDWRYKWGDSAGFKSTMEKLLDKSTSYLLKSTDNDLIVAHPSMNHLPKFNPRQAHIVAGSHTDYFDKDTQSNPNSALNYLARLI